MQATSSASVEYRAADGRSHRRSLLRSQEVDGDATSRAPCRGESRLSAMRLDDHGLRLDFDTQVVERVLVQFLAVDEEHEVRAQHLAHEGESPREHENLYPRINVFVFHGAKEGKALHSQVSMNPCFSGTSRRCCAMTNAIDSRIPVASSGHG